MKSLCAFAAIAAVLSVSGLAQAQVFTSAPGLPIVDVATVSDTIAVAGGPTSLTGVTVRINLTHTWDADMDIALVHNGQYILLSTDNGGSGDNYTNTVFDDTAATLITAGVAPFTGTYRPEGGAAAANGWLTGVPNPPAGTQNDTLGAWNGQDGNGAWDLIIADDLGGDSGTLIDWSVTLTGTSGGPTNPFGIGAASATTEVGSTLMTVTVTGGQNPPSTGLAVRGDLSGVGGSATQTFYNDGTHGDATNGDNIWSYSYSLPISVVTGNYPIAFTVSDAQSRSTNNVMSLAVSNGPSGACCNSGCTITRQTLCAQAGGAYQGAGTNCGVGYAYSTNSDAFIDISATGAILNGISNCDDCTENVTLPFNFTHLGNSYGSVNVSSNGNLQFGGSNSTAYINVNIPNTAVPNDMLAPLWDDLDMRDVNTGPGIGNCYFLDDSAANNRVIISWQGVGQYNAGGVVADANDFQVILHSNGNAEFRYGSVPAILAPQVAGDTVTIGFENSDGTDGGEYPGASIGAGNTNLVLTATNTNPCSPACDTIDFNGDGLFPDTDDITQFILVFGGGTCPTGTCGDIDYNNDGLFPDTLDISALISVFGGGDCLR